MTAPSAALYVHFPYCVSICTYCDFDRQATGFGSIPRYVEAVAADVRRQARRPIHSIFFGGGTPSLMTPEQVATILGAARDTLDVLPDCEVSVEANPGECTVDRLASFRAAGVNRLSIGVQTLDDAMLGTLTRRHTADEARAAFRTARAAGFDNVNLDFMIGLPGMTVASWLGTLDGAIELGPEHLSCYILTVDERVPMGRAVARGRLTLPDDDAVVEQYLATQARLRSAGYEQYEVSNWSRPGRACRHNLTYWRDEPYLAVGAGAAGWHDGVRFKNTPSPRRYMAAVATGRPDHVEHEEPDAATRLRDALALGLRLREGLDLDALTRKCGIDIRRALGPTIDRLAAAGCLEWLAGGRLRIAEASILVTSELIVQLEEALDAALASGMPTAGSVLADAQAGAERQDVALAPGR